MRKISYILVLFIVGFATAFSQTSESKEKTRSGKRDAPRISMHRAYLDSAAIYQRTDIEKSIDFITNSISELGKRADKKALAESLSALGDVYRYHNQYDLAITNYRDANEANRSSRTTIKLGSAYILNKEFSKAVTVGSTPVPVAVRSRRGRTCSVTVHALAQAPIFGSVCWKSHG